MTTDKVAAVWPKAEEFGFPNEMAAFGLQFGHGLGLALHERPIISRLVSLENPMEIKTGMVFALETYCPANDGYSAARIEEEVVVTDKGCRGDHAVPGRRSADRQRVLREGAMQENKHARIGWIGIGRMGFPMAERLVKAGHERARLEPDEREGRAARREGRQRSSTGRPISRTSISSSRWSRPARDLEEVYFGEDGVINGARAACRASSSIAPRSASDDVGGDPRAARRARRGISLRARVAATANA